MPFAVNKAAASRSAHRPDRFPFDQRFRAGLGLRRNVRFGPAYGRAESCQAVLDAAGDIGKSTGGGDFAAEFGDIGERVADHHHRLAGGLDPFRGLPERLHENRRVRRPNPWQLGQQHDDVNTRVIGDDFHRATQKCPVDDDVTGHVERIRDRTELRHDLGQPADGFRCVRRDLESFVVGPVGDEFPSRRQTV